MKSWPCVWVRLTHPPPCASALVASQPSAGACVPGPARSSAHPDPVAWPGARLPAYAPARASHGCRASGRLPPSCAWRAPSSLRRASLPSAIMVGTDAPGPVPGGCACAHQHRRTTGCPGGQRACAASTLPWGWRLGSPITQQSLARLGVFSVSVVRAMMRPLRVGGVSHPCLIVRHDEAYVKG